VSLDLYIKKLSNLNVNVAAGRASPHKICMLFAVFDLARGGALHENRIEFGPALLERYVTYFDAVKSGQDHANPWFPFFHLQGKLRGGDRTFWHLRAKPGREVVLNAMRTATSARQVTENIECAYLDPELFELLQNPAAIDSLSDALSKRWFNRGLSDLLNVLVRTREIGDYERLLRSTAGQMLRVAEAPAPYVRDPAFRRVVTEIYDYRCAATGLRLVLQDGAALVEAAHIHPFCEAGDDDPRNGLALTPDMHWAMDRYLIAPDTNFRWRVSSRLDRRIPDYRVLTDLEGKPLFLPKEPRMYPKREVIEWRLAQIDR